MEAEQLRRGTRCQFDLCKGVTAVLQTHGIQVHPVDQFLHQHRQTARFRVQQVIALLVRDGQPARPVSAIAVSMLPDVGVIRCATAHLAVDGQEITHGQRPFGCGQIARQATGRAIGLLRPGEFRLRGESLARQGVRSLHGFLDHAGASQRPGLRADLPGRMHLAQCIHARGDVPDAGRQFRACRLAGGSLIETIEGILLDG